MSAVRQLATAPAELGVTELPAGSFESNAKWPVLQHLDVPMTVRIPLRSLTLREVRELKADAVVSSDWPAAEEVPLYAADVALSWCEFAVVDGVMAARLTRLG